METAEQEYDQAVADAEADAKAMVEEVEKEALAAQKGVLLLMCAAHSRVTDSPASLLPDAVLIGRSSLLHRIIFDYMMPEELEELRECAQQELEDAKKAALEERERAEAEVEGKADMQRQWNGEDLARWTRYAP